MNDIAVGSSGNSGPELWGLSCNSCDTCNRTIWHRNGGPAVAWVSVAGAANHIAASPSTAVVLNSAENQMYMWNGVNNWNAISMTNGPTCMRRIATFGAFTWLRDCQASPSPQLWIYGPDFNGVVGWHGYNNQFPGPGIDVDVFAAPSVLGIPWIVNFVSPTTFQLYRSTNNVGWQLAGTVFQPSCVSSVGVGPGGSGTEAWITTCTPTGNGQSVMRLPNSNSPWTSIDSPGMTRIKVDSNFGIPFAVDNNGALWCYCDPHTQQGCG